LWEQFVALCYKKLFPFPVTPQIFHMKLVLFSSHTTNFPSISKCRENKPEHCFKSLAVPDKGSYGYTWVVRFQWHSALHVSGADATEEHGGMAGFLFSSLGATILYSRNCIFDCLEQLEFKRCDIYIFFLSCFVL